MISASQLQTRLDDLGVEHFDAAEFLRGKMPAELVDNAVRVLRLADIVRVYMGEPLILTSGYRDRATNAAVHGSSQSSHIYGAAVDLRVVKAHLRPEANLRLRRIAALIWIAYPEDACGFGCYAQNIHLDVAIPKKRRRWWTTTDKTPPKSAIERAEWLADLIAGTTAAQARSELAAWS